MSCKILSRFLRDRQLVGASGIDVARTSEKSSDWRNICGTAGGDGNSCTARVLDREPPGIYKHWSNQKTNYECDQQRVKRLRTSLPCRVLSSNKHYWLQ